MSARGIARHGDLALADAAPVELRNARRGFGKASIHADRFAMVLEAERSGRPLTATTRLGTTSSSSVQALAMRIAIGDLPAIARREGYAPEAFGRLQALAAHAGADIAEYLAALLWECGGNVVHYRERLCRRVEYTSPHYIPHPIAIDADAAIVFLAPGREGTGSPAVESVRARTGVTELMTVAEVWKRKPTESQLEYIASCFTGEAHGLRLDDLRQAVPAELADALTPHALDFESDRRRLDRLKGLAVR